jgi:hypothetical protein
VPYTFRKSGSKWAIVKKDTGEIVAHSDTLAGAKGYAWHAEHADKKKKVYDHPLAPRRMA